MYVKHMQAGQSLDELLQLDWIHANGTFLACSRTARRRQSADYVDSHALARLVFLPIEFEQCLYVCYFIIIRPKIG